jgi:hypothetical protein
VIGGYSGEPSDGRWCTAGGFAVWFPVWVFALLHLASVVFLLIAGHVVLVVPARDRPHCLVPARCTHIGLVGGHAVGGFLLLTTCGQIGPIGLPGLGLLAGGAGGFVVGQLARVVLVKKGDE